MASRKKSRKKRSRRSAKSKTKASPCPWIYSLPHTERHPVVENMEFKECIHLVLTIITDNGGRSRYFKNEKAINVDCIEEKLRRSQPLKTVDMAFVARDRKKPDPEASDLRTVLVELKMGVRNVNNLRRNDFEDKVRNSIDILGNEPQILQDYFFVFNDRVRNQAEHSLYRIFNKPPMQLPYKIVSLKELIKSFFRD